MWFSSSRIFCTSVYSNFSCFGADKPCSVSLWAFTSSVGTVASPLLRARGPTKCPPLHASPPFVLPRVCHLRGSPGWLFQSPHHPWLHVQMTNILSLETFPWPGHNRDSLNLHRIETSDILENLLAQGHNWSRIKVSPNLHSKGWMILTERKVRYKKTWKVSMAKFLQIYELLHLYLFLFFS